MKLFFVLFVMFFSSFSLFAQSGLSKAQRDAIEKIMAPLRLKVEMKLKKANPKQYENYLRDLKALKYSSDTVKQKMEQMEFYSKYYSFIKNGWAEAKINEVATKKSIEKILKEIKYKINFGEFLSITGVLINGSNIPPPYISDLPDGCSEIWRCPVKNTNMPEVPGIRENAVCEAFSSTVAVGAYGWENFSATGNNVSVSRSMQKVDVSCRMQYNIEGTAFSSLGGGYIEGSVGLKINGPGANVQLEFISAFAVAPVIWFHVLQNPVGGNFMEVSFAPSRSGGDYTIQAYAKTFCLSAILSRTECSARVSNFDPIRVCEVK